MLNVWLIAHVSSDLLLFEWSSYGQTQDKAVVLTAVVVLKHWNMTLIMMESLVMDLFMM